jgi:hypothetical protein
MWPPATWAAAARQRRAGHRHARLDPRPLAALAAIISGGMVVGMIVVWMLGSVTERPLNDVFFALALWGGTFRPSRPASSPARRRLLPGGHLLRPVRFHSRAGGPAMALAHKKTASVVYAAGRWRLSRRARARSRPRQHRGHAARACGCRCGAGPRHPPGQGPAAGRVLPALYLLGLVALALHFSRSTLPALLGHRALDVSCPSWTAPSPCCGQPSCLPARCPCCWWNSPWRAWRAPRSSTPAACAPPCCRAGHFLCAGVLFRGRLRRLGTQPQGRPLLLPHRARQRRHQATGGRARPAHRGHPVLSAGQRSGRGAGGYFADLAGRRAS